jgi:Putative peptidoglycan binding domain
MIPVPDRSGRECFYESTFCKLNVDVATGKELMSRSVFRFWRRRAPDAHPVRRCFGVTAGSILTVVIALAGCAPSDPVDATSENSMSAQSEASPNLPEPELETSETSRSGTLLEPMPPRFPGAGGKTVWASGFEGDAIAGLDGGLYVPYRPSVIEIVQQALTARGVYDGPANGILDAPTMYAIYVFQQASGFLQRCGVPTPRTRKLLEQGSHTDPAGGVVD